MGLDKRLAMTTLLPSYEFGLPPPTCDVSRIVQALRASRCALSLSKRPSTSSGRNRLRFDRRHHIAAHKCAFGRLKALSTRPNALSWPNRLSVPEPRGGRPERYRSREMESDVEHGATSRRAA